MSRSAAGAVEVYGESPSRPLFSAEFDLAPQRAATLALSELRLAPDTAPRTLEEILPKPAVNPVAKRSFPQCTAVRDGAVRGLSPVCSGGQRAAARSIAVSTPARCSSRLWCWPPSFSWWPVPWRRTRSWSEKQYLKQINAEIARLEPLHKRADALDRETERARARAQLLDQFRKQTRMDLDALNELTHLLEPPAWSNNIDLARDSVRISGEAPQTAPLLKILDASPFFEKTEIQMSAPQASGETFQIRTNRRRGK